MSDYVPFEMQEDIMKRLPTKSLLRLRCVSKPWKSLIDSPRFIADYSLNHTHQEHLLVNYTSIEEEYISFVEDDSFPEHKCSMTDIISMFGEHSIVGSCQGLFCLRIRCSDPPQSCSFFWRFVLWNPSIRKTVTIDRLPSVRAAYGFGVCPRTSDPKLVKIEYIPRYPTRDTLPHSHWRVEVYTLSSGTWRSIPTINQPRKSIDLIWINQVVIGGLIYWHALDHLPEFKEDNLIMSFDMTSEEFMEISLPDALARANKFYVVLSKIKESLVVVEMVIEPEKRVFGVWMMEHGVPNSFTKLYTINSPGASIDSILVVRGFRKNNQPVCVMRSNYNFRDIIFRELHLEHTNSIQISCTGCIESACPYMETLLLLGGPHLEKQLNDDHTHEVVEKPVSVLTEKHDLGASELEISSKEQIQEAVKQSKSIDEDGKKGRKKGKGLSSWYPFVCCSSIYVAD